MKRNKKKSPLVDNPLRLPGQSLEDQIQEIIGSEVLMVVFLPIFMIAQTVFYWLLWYQVIRIPNPLTITFFTIFISVYCFLKFFGIRRKIKTLRLGRDGERAVGQMLERFRDRGFKIFHDVVGQGFNLDHVIVCEYGVYCIETKTYSKPEKGECKVIVDNNGISINGYKSEKKIPIQAEAQKSWLEKQIAKLTGIKLTVKPVVVFPGWFIENRSKVSSLWVLEPKALHK